MSVVVENKSSSQEVSTSFMGTSQEPEVGISSTTVTSMEVQSAFYHSIEHTDVGERTVFTFKPIGFLAEDVQVEQGVSKSSSAAIMMTSNIPSMTATKRTNLNDSPDATCIKNKLDNGGNPEDLNFNIPHVTSKSRDMQNPSKMDIQIGSNITSDLLSTENSVWFRIAPSDETIQPAITCENPTLDISCHTMDTCTLTDMVEEVEDCTQTDFKLMVDCNAQTDKVILTCNEVQTNLMETEDSAFQTDIKMTINYEVQTEIKDTTDCEVQTDLNSDNIHSVDKLEIVKSMESFPTQTDPNKLLMMSSLHPTAQLAIQSPN